MLGLGRLSSTGLASEPRSNQGPSRTSLGPSGRAVAAQGRLGPASLERRRVGRGTAGVGPTGVRSWCGGARSEEWGPRRLGSARSRLLGGASNPYSPRADVLDSSSLHRLSRSGRSVPLVGRRDELETIARARAEDVSGVVVHAPAGVGKSRLARAAVAQADSDGAVTAWVQATRSAASVPLGPFAGVIPTEVRSDDPFELFRLSVRALRDLAGSGSLMVAVDDAQLLDATSAALVLQLASTGAAFVLATVRSGESCRDAIVSLWKDAGARRLALSSLSEDETREFVESIVGGPVEESALRWVWEGSQGNALYAHELIVGVLENGILTEVSGLWRLGRRPPISPSLAELVSGRMAGLARPEYRVLELLALGEPLRLAELRELSGTEPLAAVEDRGLISVAGASPGAEVRLAHPLYGEVIRSALRSVRAREVRLQLAEVLLARGQLTAEESLRVCVLLVDAGEAPSGRMLINAAAAANLSGAADLGGELAGRAVKDGAGVEASMLLARSHAIQKQFAQAESVLGELEREIDSRDVAVAYLKQRIRVLYWGMRRPMEARALLERAQDWWPDPGWRRQLDPVRAELAALLDSFSGAVEGSAGMLADDSLEPEARREIELVHAMNLFYSGRVLASYELIRTLKPAIPLTDHHDERALIGLCLISFESGQALPELEHEMAAVLMKGVRAGDHAASGLGALTLGSLAFLAGRYRDAAHWLAEAEVHFEHRDMFGALTITRAFQVGVACFTADKGIGVALGRCEDALQGREPLPNQIPYLARARAWAAVARNDRRGAQRLLFDTVALLEHMPLHAAQLSYEALRAGAPATTVARSLSALRGRCDARLMAAYAAHSAARAADDGSALLAAADEFERIGALRYASEAAAQAAEVFLDAGRQDSARRAAARSRELFIDGQGGVQPPVEGLTRTAVELSAREQELVELARQGLSNPQIAQRLVLSSGRSSHTCTERCTSWESAIATSCKPRSATIADEKREDRDHRARARLQPAIPVTVKDRIARQPLSRILDNRLRQTCGPRWIDRHR